MREKERRGKEQKSRDLKEQKSPKTVLLPPNCYIDSTQEIENFLASVKNKVILTGLSPVFKECM